jgi:O-antigen ligase
MAVASSLPRTSSDRSTLPVLLVAGLALVGVLGGVALALGELDALYISLSVIGALAILLDYRVGAVLLIIFLPVSESSLFPRAVLGLTGLNPLNILVGATLVSFLLRWNGMRFSEVLPPRLLWLYLVPICIAGLIGSRHVAEIPPQFFDNGSIRFIDAAGYLRDMLLKPLEMVLIALLVGAAVTRAQKPERFIVPLIVSVWIMALVAIQYVVFANVRLADLASPEERIFFSGVGLHANDLGRMYAVAYALLLFVWWETKGGMLKTVLLATMGLLVVALLLTFSRGAFLGFVIVNMLFLLWKFNMRTIALGILAIAIGAILLPGAVYDRIALGFNSGGTLNDVSAGRIDGIWLPLLPEVLNSPIWGNGLGSTLWSYAMRNGLMLDVGHPHNAYLETVLDLGFVGLGLICAYFVGVWNGFRKLGSNDYLSPELRGFFQGAAAGLVSFAITGAAGSSLVPKPEYVFLWLAIGMMYGQLARKPAAES